MSSNASIPTDRLALTPAERASLERTIAAVPARPSGGPFALRESRIRYASIRTPGGHDSGRIHSVRMTSNASIRRTDCGRFIAERDIIPHSIGPTCKPCKANVR